MEQKPREPKPKREVRLHGESKSKQIIEYLFQHGKTSGERIMKDLGLPNSPKAYIQPHIRTERVICNAIHCHKATYAINSQMTKQDFGLTG